MRLGVTQAIVTQAIVTQAMVLGLVAAGCARPSVAPQAPAHAPRPSPPIPSAQAVPARDRDTPDAWSLACDRGDADACLRLAEAYYYGEYREYREHREHHEDHEDEVIEKNLVRMAQLEKRACELGSAKGCAWLGNTHVVGHPGFPRDLPRAVGLWVQACDEGWAPACLSAARAYHDGVGVPADDKRARGLLDQGCRLGAEDQCDGAEALLDGPLTVTAIREVVTEGVDLVSACHDLALLADPSIHGRVTVRLSISPQGRVVDADAVDNDTGDAELGDCIANATRALQFPPPGGDREVVLTYPFVLAPRAGSRPTP